MTTGSATPATAEPEHTDLLQVRDLEVEYRSRERVVTAVNRASLTLRKGETLVVLGESGSGKSSIARAVLRLLPPAGKVTGGQITFQGTDLLRLPERQMRSMRGKSIAAIFQDAMSSMNPSYSVGSQIAEVLRLHQQISRRDAHQRAISLMHDVHIPAAAQRARQYPHEFSGGMQQRAAIAMALGLRPDLVVADEPTSALDVTVQAQILLLLSELQTELGMGLLLITHDLGVAAKCADEVVVMLSGQVVEQGPLRSVYQKPAHPYTQNLLRARLGQPLSLSSRPQPLTERGCQYARRCAFADAKCSTEPPPFVVSEGTQWVRCHYPALVRSRPNV